MHFFGKYVFNKENKSKTRFYTPKAHDSILQQMKIKLGIMENQSKSKQ